MLLLVVGAVMLVGSGLLPWARFFGGEPTRLIEPKALDDEAAWMLVPIAILVAGLAAGLPLMRGVWRRLAGGASVLMGALAWLIAIALVDPALLAAEHYQLLLARNFLLIAGPVIVVGGAAVALAPRSFDARN